MRRISKILSKEDHRVPDLALLGNAGNLIFIPFGGGHVRAWGQRLAPLGLPEFHLYDRELPPETDLRVQAAGLVNERDQCRAFVTGKRCLENYLHPDAIRSAGKIEVRFDDFDCLSKLTARELYQQRPGETPWQLRARRSQSRMANRAKRWLCTVAVDHMTPQLLAERDPSGEILSWMLAINEILKQ
ncbi:ATP-dependent endonuclease [Roseiconus lacunae]|uniref:ATP-dependent endonuclease n=1 Tax=Roseiconus lacunae TaxID=2605694 RepID=UPI001E2CDD81|nr:ATP-dependent endonuclease [Roseiconus lacunae]MCD0462488.1 ATP-dependent endonuclease [Roseiconus lacunae]